MGGFMRLELIHPMLIHFPIALLLTGAALKAAAFFFRHSKSYGALVFSARLILCLGVLFAWAAVFAGHLASHIIEKSLCFPLVLDYHSLLGHTAAILFTIGVLCDGARIWTKKRSFNKALMVGSSLLFMVGAGILLMTAAFGGSLVYDQGAAVETRCK